MSKREGASTGSGAGSDPLAAAPASPEAAASQAAAAAQAPNPPPPVATSKGALQGATDFLPAALQPVGMMLVGLFKVLYAMAVPLARIAYRLAIWSSPLLIWAGMKYVNWYFFGWLNKAGRIMSWAKWILSFFKPAAAAGA